MGGLALLAGFRPTEILGMGDYPALDRFIWDKVILERAMREAKRSVKY